MNAHTPTIVVSRLPGGHLLIEREDRVTNYPAGWTLLAIVGKYGDETHLALTDEELTRLRAAL